MFFDGIQADGACFAKQHQLVVRTKEHLVAVRAKKQLCVGDLMVVCWRCVRNVWMRWRCSSDAPVMFDALVICWHEFAPKRHYIWVISDLLRLIRLELLLIVCPTDWHLS